MSTTTTTTNTTGPVAAGDVELYVDQRGSGPDVLLIAGLSDPAEAWAFQLAGLADRHRMTAFDNRGVGRSPMPPEGWSVAGMADDAAEVLGALGIDRAHVCGSPAAAARPRSSRCAIPRSCAAWCWSARGHAATPSSAP
jgi:hypothetical protein